MLKPCIAFILGLPESELLVVLLSPDDNTSESRVALSKYATQVVPYDARMSSIVPASISILVLLLFESGLKTHSGHVSMAWQRSIALLLMKSATSNGVVLPLDADIAWPC